MGNEQEIVQAAAATCGVQEALVIYTAKIDVKESVAMLAQYSPHHGNVWSYSPHVPTPDKMRTILKEYSKAALVIAENHPDFRAALLKLENLLMQKGYTRAFAMVSGPCAFCEKCSILDGKPCVKPDLLRPSLEAAGVDIISTVKKFKKNALVPPRGAFGQYGLVLLE